MFRTPLLFSAKAKPIVVIKQPNGSLRICTNLLAGLNAALEQHHYTSSVPDGLFTILNSGSYSVKSDLVESYLQAEVESSCRELLIVNTSLQLFQYNQLPLG